MKKLMIILVVFLLISQTAKGQTDAPYVYNDIDVNGVFDDVTEWANAAVIPASSNGTLRMQTRQNWVAKSSSGNSSMQPGWTLQFIWDLYGADFNVDTDWMYNKFYFGFERDIEGDPNHRMRWFTAWIFDSINHNDADDSIWIGESGLGYETFDDRGFFIRAMDDPNTERHWFPGDPEPGDPCWTDATWNHYFGFFGKGNYNNSAYTQGYRSTPATANPVFEYVINDRPGNTRQWDVYGPVIQVLPCVFAQEVEHWISDPDRMTGKDTLILVLPDIHPKPKPPLPPPVDGPTVTQWGLIVMAVLLLAAGAIVIRRKFKTVPA
jgi:hypothetical protein